MPRWASKNDKPIRGGHLYLAPLIRSLRGHGVQRLTLAKGLDHEECLRLVEGLSSIADLDSTAHVVLGKVLLGDVDGSVAGGDSSAASQSEFSEQDLQAIGLAAMLHDIGKLSLPKVLLYRDEELTDIEWEILKMHTVLGATQLCGLPEATPLAILVAYEHHLRWDGKPSYPVTANARRPNLASQLTAIADTYDVMVESRGLTGGVHGEATVKVWRERSETFLDPFLVGNFILMLAGVEGEIEDADNATSPAELT